MYYSGFMHVQYKITLHYNSMDVDYSSSIGHIDFVFTLSLKVSFSFVAITQLHVTYTERNTVNESCRTECTPLYIVYLHSNQCTL